MPTPNQELVYTYRLELEDLNAASLADSIREDLTAADAHLHDACEKLALALRRRDWRNLGYPDADSYIQEELHISPGWGYALARVAEMKQQFPNLAERIESLSVSSATTVASAFPQDRKTRAIDADEKSVKGLVEIAERSTVRHLRATVRESNFEGNPPHANAPIYAYCPHCGGKLQVSRAVEITAI